MHELSITEAILDYSIREAERQNAAKVRAIRLRLGPFSGIVPECIQMYLDVLAEGTMAEDARIEAELLPLKVLCRDCGKESEITRKRIACPGCGSLRLKVLSGKECLIYSLEIEEKKDSIECCGKECGGKKEAVKNGNPGSSSDHGVE